MLVNELLDLLAGLAKRKGTEDGLGVLLVRIEKREECGLLSLGDFTFSDRLVKKCSVCRLAGFRNLGSEFRDLAFQGTDFRR